MDPSTISSAGQAAGSIAIAIVAAIIGVFNYLKKQERAAPEKSGAVVSASFIDSKLIKELIDVVREHQEESNRDAKRSLRSIQELREATQENTEAIIVQTDSTSNLLKFLSKMVPRANRVTDVEH